MLRRILYCTILVPGLALAQTLQQPAYVLMLPESTETVLIAETDTATLHRFRFDGVRLIPVDQQAMSIGQNGVGKQIAGDRRTPLGVYFITEELDTSRLHEKYGPVAFPLDYPNVRDVQNRRNGSGIWIHGVAPASSPRPDRDTDGCIALQNAGLLELKPFLVPGETPVIVVRSIRFADTAEIEGTRDRLEAALQQWADSFRDGDWFRFQSLYAPDFSYRSMSRAEWLEFRLQSANRRPLTEFQIEELMLFFDPEEPDLLISRFRQRTTGPDGSLAVTKRLYWRSSPGPREGALQIVAEDNG